MEKNFEKIYQKLKNEHLEHTFNKIVLEFEDNLQNLFDGVDIRNLITGPLIQQVYKKCPEATKRLNTGVELNFPIRSKISRDFLMAREKNPDHVWEPQTTKLLHYFTKDVKNVLIGGAYWGDHAIVLSKEFPKARFHCFELDLSNISFFKKNLENNEIKNISIIEKALWHESGRHVSLSGVDCLASCQESTASDLNSFDTITIDQYVTENRLAGIDLIMLDIEGGELNALLGAKSLLRDNDRSPVVIFEVHNNYVDWSHGLKKTEIIEHVSSYGYNIFAVRDYHTNEKTEFPIELIPIDSVYLEGPAHGFNMLAIKDIDMLSGKEFKIVENLSPKLLRHRSNSLFQPST